MPGNLNPANPTQVMPYGLCRAFREDLRLEALLNTYPDGSSDRNALASNVRHFYTMTRGLNATDWQALYNFYVAVLGQPFYFYNLRETVPPWTWDASGASTVGRYTVVFDGQWSDQYNVARTDVNVSLREVV